MCAVNLWNLTDIPLTATRAVCTAAIFGMHELNAILPQKPRADRIRSYLKTDLHSAQNTGRRNERMTRSSASGPQETPARQEINPASGRSGARWAGCGGLCRGTPHPVEIPAAESKVPAWLWPGDHGSAASILR